MTAAAATGSGAGARRRPRFVAPPGSADCHAHVFGPYDRFPLAAERRYTPPAATFGDYRALLARLGIERAVVVQGSPCGTDNSVTLDAIARSAGRFVGIAVVDPAATDAELEALAAGGIRGVRLNAALRSGVDPATLEQVARRVSPLGWHVQLLLGACSELAGFAPVIERLPVPVAIDHLGSVTGAQSPDAPGFRRLLGLLAGNDHVWVRLSSFYRRSRTGPPYDDMRAFAEALVAARPDRLLWGSNWPHPHWEGTVPDDADLLDLFAEWIAAPSLQRAILVDNPQRLFGFAPCTTQ